MQTGPLFSSSSSEERWVNHISRNYSINLKTRPCIFQVPHKLKDEKPEAYTPQGLGLGLYHHLRPELQEMESLKRASVKAFLSEDEDDVPLKFDTENRRKILHSEILPHYDTYVDLDSKTLVWILVIDGIFLLQFLKEQKNWEDRRMVAELMMLENQIPMALLEEINKGLKENLFPAVLNNVLLDQFKKFCVRYSPLKLSQDSQRMSAAFEDKKHLLHFLYKLIVENFTTEMPRDNPPPLGSNSGWDLRRAISGPLRFAKEVTSSCASAISEAKAQGLRLPELNNHVSKLLEQLQKTSDLYGNGDKILQQSLAQKIDVPSVSQLHVIAKINFACTDGGVRNISFDKDTLYLPEITLGETSEIILRNLVAYEAATKPAGSILELTEYVDLICGIIKAENDVNLLRQFGIIKGDLSDQQIVCIFNGINKTTKIPPEQSETQRIVQKLSKLLPQEETSDSDPHASGKENDDQNPLVNEIEVPSASKLQQKAELKFTCRGGGKRIILFDEKKNTLSLPEISLDNNPKEAVKKFSQAEPEYLDFMCAIIEFDDDVGLLRENGIIKGDDDLTDWEIFEAFIENKKSIQWPIKLSLVQETVQKLNKKFRDIRIVKAYKFMENSSATFQSWIKRIFPTLVLLLLLLQSFCEIYGCAARRSGYLTVPGDSSFGVDGSEVKLMMPRKFLRYDLNPMLPQ